ncbi:hypothetical protein [Emticicia agri]|uniref:Uncharacterized protein n=1 Tax=Emticicia agri TaxID=2492393 RepID=A0A4Q5LP41_9BACT|nr:hypothetical protein [Emticicia agri]RYU91049.1 hypothetical protein EWM59_27095 [Emticicia agri]
MEAIAKKNQSKILTDIIELYKEKIIYYQNDKDKELAISLLNMSISLIKKELKDKSLSRELQLTRIDLLHEFMRKVDILTITHIESITQVPENIENYPPYHLHKKSQSAFGKVK